MPNAKDATGNENIGILAIGDIGVGKTTQFATLPGKKFAYFFDPNALTSLKGQDIDYEEYRVDSMDLDLSIKSLKKDVGDKPGTKRRLEPKTYKEWEEDFESKLDSGFFHDYDWVCLDSMTTFSDIVMDRVQFLNGRLGKHPEQGDWTAQMGTIRNVFRALFGIGCNIYCAAHHDLKQDELSNRIFNQLMLTGKLRKQIPLLFTEVLVLATARDMEKGIVHQMQTKPDRENPTVRCTLKDVGQFEDITLDWSKDLVGQGLGQFFK